jgi:hypothetical protein
MKPRVVFVDDAEDRLQVALVAVEGLHDGAGALDGLQSELVRGGGEASYKLTLILWLLMFSKVEL